VQGCCIRKSIEALLSSCVPITRLSRSDNSTGAAHDPLAVKEQVKRHLSCTPIPSSPSPPKSPSGYINIPPSFFLFVSLVSKFTLGKAETSYKKLSSTNAAIPSRSTSMTLSSTSRQQRKSMLPNFPKPRPSSRITARRVTSGDTAYRIAWRVPSPLPESGLRRAGSPSRIPWSAAGQTRTSSGSCPTPDRSESSSSLMSRTPSSSLEVKKRTGVNVQYYPTPPASAEVKHDRFFKSQEGRGLGRTTIPAAQHQGMRVVEAGTATPPARHPFRRPASVSTTSTFSRVDNASPRDASGGGIPALNTRKKLAFMSNGNFSGKENRRPRMYTRVPPPSVASALTTIPGPPRSIRRTVVAQPPSRAASSRETPSPSRPLVVRKQLPLAGTVDSSPIRSASGASGALPVAGPVQALIVDIDRFAKELTEMFDELSAGAEDPEDRLSKLDASIRIWPTSQPRPESTGPLQADNPTAAVGKGKPRQ
jgi:hypothetical protein